MKERDEIAELFKDRLEHHAEPVDPALWAKVQTGLAGKTLGGAAATGKLTGIIKLIAVSSILVGSAIGVGVWLQRSNKGYKTERSEAHSMDNAIVKNEVEISEVEPIENTIQVSEAHNNSSTGLANNQTETSSKLTMEEQVSTSIKENPVNQTNQAQNNTITNSPEAGVSASPKAIDSKNNTNQSPIDPPNTTAEKNHNILLTSEIPNIFTPNGDGKNDLFSIPVADNVAHTTKVFSQKGELIAEFTQASSGWDGTKTGGAEVANGTYFYVTFVSDQVGNQKQIKGTINLVR